MSAIMARELPVSTRLAKCQCSMRSDTQILIQIQIHIHRLCRDCRQLIVGVALPGTTSSDEHTTDYFRINPTSKDNRKNRHVKTVCSRA